MLIIVSALETQAPCCH